MAYDDILEHLGEFGPYQRRIYLLLCLPAICTAFHKMANVFLQAKAEHRCLLPFESSNASYFDLTEHQMQMAYPWDSLAKSYSSCRMYNTNYTEEYFQSNKTATDTVSCKQWVYNTEKYHSTTVMEWDLVCDKAWMKTTSDSIFMIGILLGSIIFGALSDRYGRSPIYSFSLVLIVVSGMLEGIAPEYFSHVFCRMVVGACTSGVYITGYVIATEMVGAKMRMFLSTGLQFSFTVGYLMIAGFAYFFKDWRNFQIAISVPGIFFFCYYWLIPESACWLSATGHQEEFKRTLLVIAKENKVEIDENFIDNLVASIKKENTEEPDEKSSLLDALRYPRMRRKSIIIFFLWFVISGVYYGLSWNTSHLGGGDDIVNFLISGIVEIPANIFLLLTLNRWGRKVILCGCMLSAGTVLLLTMFVPNNMVWLTITLAMAGKLATTGSYDSVYIFSAELFPTVIRNAGIGASSLIARFGDILAPYVIMLADVWIPLPLLIFGSLMLCGGILALTLPETHNKVIPETIQEGEEFGK